MKEKIIGYHCRSKHLFFGIYCSLNKGHEGNHQYLLSWQNDEVKKK